MSTSTQEYDRISGTENSNEGERSRTSSASSIRVNSSPKSVRKKFEKDDPRRLMSETEIAIMERKKAKKRQELKEKIEKEAAERERLKKEADDEKEQMMLKAGPLQKLKMSIAQMQKALWSLELTQQQRQDLNDKIMSCQNKMHSLEAETCKPTEVSEHYAFMCSNPDLVKVLRLFWICLLQYVHNGDLSEEGYIELSIAGQYALMDNLGRLYYSLLISLGHLYDSMISTRMMSIITQPSLFLFIHSSSSPSLWISLQ